ncbi:amino acid permease [bacterium]|nr:amino acid permease [bacterium]
MRDTIFRKKSLQLLKREQAEHGKGLKRVLGPWSLIALGIGCTVGAGIFIMPGEVAAMHAGPAVVLSFLLAALACALAAMSYCELAAMIPISGSAYSYAYATLGEVIAWFIGWNLLLEYGLANAATAAGWAGYLNRLLSTVGLEIPPQLMFAPGQAIPGTELVGWFNLPAVLAVVLVTGLLLLGIRESARANALIVGAKLAVLVLFVALCAPGIQPQLVQNYMPFGWQGVVSGAAVLFFLFVGFDAVSTVAEEAKDPQRNLPIGILAGLGIVTILYVAVGTVLTGVLPLDKLQVGEPLAIALATLNHPRAAALLSAVAVVGIFSVLLVGSIGQSRILYVMSRDGLMPRFMSNVHARTGTPVETTLVLGVLTAALAAVVPLSALADLVSIGTLAAFIAVSAGVIMLRKTDPDAPRTFRCPWVPGLPLAGIAINLYLMSGLGLQVWIRFLIWLAVGGAVYYFWGYRSAGRVMAAREAVVAKSAEVVVEPS